MKKIVRKKSKSDELSEKELRRFTGGTGKRQHRPVKIPKKFITLDPSQITEPPSTRS